MFAAENKEKQRQSNSVHEFIYHNGFRRAAYKEEYISIFYRNNQDCYE
jgi:hypothetical protein